MERLIRNDFFQNPFGGGMNPMGGGSNGVLETIQQQVMNNGQALQSLQSGIGGLPSGNLPPGGIGGNPADLHKKSPQPGGGFNPGDIGLIPQEPPMVTGPGGDLPPNVGFTDDQLRADYDKAVEDARRQRAEGFMGRVVLPGEMPFEFFKESQIAVANSGPLLQTQMDLFNIAGKAEPNPGMDYSQLTPTIGNLYNDTDTGSPQILDYDRPGYASTFIDQQIFNAGFRPGTEQLTNAGNRGYTGGGSPPVFNNGVNINQNQTSGMDPLFGRAFAGKPI
jgi:hypothetical protein